MTAGPDGGFAWVIALCCFFINFITVGISRSVGVLYVELIEVYGVSREAATTPFSIRVFITNFAGPIVGIIGLKYGIRGVMVIGGLLASIGSLLTSIAPEIFWISIFWGVIHGFGFCLSTCLHMLTINQYFEKHRASALGFGYSGDCFGNFLFPFLIEYLLRIYNISGTFLIIGGILLHIIPIALILKKPPWIKNISNSGDKNLPKQPSLKKDIEFHPTEMIKNSETHFNFYHVSNDVREKKSFERRLYKISEPNKNATIPNRFLSPSFDKIGIKNEAYNSSETDLDASHNKTYFKNKEKGKNGKIEINTIKLGEISSSDLSDNDLGCYSLRSVPLIKKDIIKTSSSTESLPCLIKKDRTNKNSTKIVKCGESAGNVDDLYKAVIFRERKIVFENRYNNYRGNKAEDFFKTKCTQKKITENDEYSFVNNVSNESNKNPLNKYEFDVNQKYRQIGKNNALNVDLSINKNRTGDVLKKFHEKENAYLEDRENPSGILNILLRTNLKPMFILISISSAVYAFLLTSILTIVIDYASDQGIPKYKGKYLIVGFSIADLIGRLTYGQVIDRKIMKIKNYAGTNILLMGVISIIMPLNISFLYMMVCMCIYGIIQGGVAIMFPILLNKYIDKNTHSVAMGCLNLYGGLLILLLAPTISFFRDNSGSYNSIFYISGGITALVGILWQFEPVILKLKKQDQRNVI